MKRTPEPPPPTTSSERTSSALCHGLSIVMPWLAPLGFTVYGLASRSRFVASHGIAALIESLLATIGTILVITVSIGYTLVVWTPRLLESGFAEVGWDALWQTVVKGIAIWLFLAVVGLIYAVQSVLQAIAAYRGAPPRGGWVGRLSSRWAAGLVPLRANEPAPPAARRIGE